MPNYLNRIYEEALGSDVDFFKEESLVGKLAKSDCLDFIKSEINTFVNSNLTNKLGLGVKEKYDFLRGTVYGYVYGKTSDKKLAVEAGGLAVETAEKYNKDVK